MEQSFRSFKAKAGGGSALSLGLMLSLLLILLNSTACAPGASTPAGELNFTEGQGILGGEKAQANRPGFASVVMLIGPEARSGKAQELDFSSCTGVLIGDGLVLTAAHCVKPLQDQTPAFHSGALADLGLVAFAGASGETRPVTGFFIHESYVGWRWIQTRKGYVPRTPNDVALVSFSGGTPAGTEIARIAQTDTQTTLQYPFHFFGYGLTGTTELDEAERSQRIGRGRQAFIAETSLQYLKREAAFSAEFDYGFLLDQRGQPGTCLGDSGGPAFIEQDGRATLVAVTSHSTGAFEERRMDVAKATEKVGHICQYFSVLTRVSLYSAWIEKAKQVLLENDCSKRPDFRNYVAGLLAVKESEMGLTKLQTSKQKLYRFKGRPHAQFENVQMDLQVDPQCRVQGFQGYVKIKDELVSPRLQQLRHAFTEELKSEHSQEGILSDLLPEPKRRFRGVEPQLASAVSVEVLLKGLAAHEGWTLHPNRHIVHTINLNSATRRGSPAELGSSFEVLSLMGIEAQSEALTEGLKQGLRMVMIIYMDDRGGEHRDLWVRDLTSHEIWLLRQIVTRE